jgi:hypothetical protein
MVSTLQKGYNFGLDKVVKVRHWIKFCMKLIPRWAGHVARMGEKRNMYRFMVGKPEGKRPLGRPRRRWIHNIKTELLGIGLNVMDWIDLAQDRYNWKALVNLVMNLQDP